MAENSTPTAPLPEDSGTVDHGDVQYVSPWLEAARSGQTVTFDMSPDAVVQRLEGNVS